MSKTVRLSRGEDGAANDARREIDLLLPFVAPLPLETMREA